MFTRRFTNVAFMAMLCLFALWTGTSRANLHAIPNDHFTKSIFDVLAQKEVLEMSLSTDLGHLIENRKKEIEQPATLAYKNERGENVSYEIKITPRGKFRRRTCDFPPLKLKFPKSGLTAQGLSSHNDLKLVTHCLDNKAIGNEQLLKEYLAYRLYNLLTDKSYRVQLVEITYTDSEGKNGKQKRYGFLIEDTDEMAERLGGLECDCMNPLPETVNGDEERLMATFQYMIGNADWSSEMNRNLKVVQTLNGANTLVPYDFDFTGWVSPNYARLNSNYDLKSMKERIYLGFPASDGELWETINYLRSKRTDMIAEIKDFKLLSMTAREQMLSYLDEFFEIATQLETSRNTGIYERLKRPSRFILQELEAPVAKPKGVSTGK